MPVVLNEHLITKEKVWWLRSLDCPDGCEGAYVFNFTRAIEPSDKLVCERMESISYNLCVRLTGKIQISNETYAANEHAVRDYAEAHGAQFVGCGFAGTHHADYTFRFQHYSDCAAFDENVIREILEGTYARK